MMKIKLLEIRDEMTFIPVLCVDMNPDMEWDSPHSDRQLEPDEGQRYLLRRVGYPCDGRPKDSQRGEVGNVDLRLAQAVDQNADYTIPYLDSCPHTGRE